MSRYDEISGDIKWVYGEHPPNPISDTIWWMDAKLMATEVVVANHKKKLKLICCLKLLIICLSSFLSPSLCQCHCLRRLVLIYLLLRVRFVLGELFTLRFLLFAIIFIRLDSLIIIYARRKRFLRFFESWECRSHKSHDIVTTSAATVASFTLYHSNCWQLTVAIAFHNSQFTFGRRIYFRTKRRQS